MGNCAQTETDLSSISTIGIRHFTKHYIIGRGGFSRVWKATHKKTSKLYAIKEIPKDLIVQRQSVHQIMNERKILGVLKNNFIVNMHYAFQTKTHLYMVFDMMHGGDFRHYILHEQVLDEEQLKFLAVCLIEGLNYLHSNSVVHRDIKPENIIIGDTGYFHITDFGISRMIGIPNQGIVSGTPGYMAPEIILGKEHGFLADYFAVGVILYECIIHKRPYEGNTRKEYRESVLNKRVKLFYSEEIKFSKECIDFVNKLIKRKPEKRIGNNGFDEVKNHPWLMDYDWDKLRAHSIASPFNIVIKDNFDEGYVSKPIKKLNFNVTSADSHKYFNGFFYDYNVFGPSIKNY